MRTRDTVFSLLIVVVLLAALWIAVLQNPQVAQWTFLGQTFPLAAGVAAAGAALIGFLLAVLFVLPFVGASGATTATQAAATATSERDLITSREQYRQLQAEHNRLQASYSQLVAERDLLQAQQTTAPTASSSTQSPAPAPMAQSTPNGPEMARTHVWGVPDQSAGAEPSTDALTGATAPSDSGDPNTRIAMPSLPPDGTTGAEAARQDPPLPQLPVLTYMAVPQADLQPPVSVSSSDTPDRTAPTALAPTDTRVDLPPGRQVIRPDGSILEGNDAPPPPAESSDTTVSH